MVNALIKKIILYDDKVEIIYNFDEDSPDNDRDCLFYTKTIKQLVGDLRIPKKCNHQIDIALFCWFFKKSIILKPIKSLENYKRI